MNVTWKHFSPFSISTQRLLSILATGLEGHGAYTITASKNGLSLKFGRLLVAKGKDCDEVIAKLDLLLAKVKQAKNADDFVKLHRESK